MADIDMIPRSYREALRVKRLLRRCGGALCALLLVGLGAGATLRWRVFHTETALVRLRAASAQSLADAARLAQLQSRQAGLQQAVTALAALRAGGAVGQVTAALDAALGGELWFTTLRYARSEQVIPAGAGLAPQAGDLVLQASSPPGAPETWRITRRLDVGGAAFSYPALSEFLRQVSSQPGVAQVRLIDSSAPEGSSAADAAAIGFNMTAIVKPAGGVTP
jgi:hypothetical protein